MSNQPPLSPTSSSQVYDPPSESGKVLAVAGLVFALISLLAVPFFFLLGAFFPIGLFVGIASSMVGIILSAPGLRAPSRRGLAIVGLTLSVVVFVLLVLLILFYTSVRVERTPAPTPTGVPIRVTP